MTRYCEQCDRLILADSDESLYWHERVAHTDADSDRLGGPESDANTWLGWLAYGTVLIGLGVVLALILTGLGVGA